MFEKKKRVYSNSFKAEIFTLAAKLKALVGAQVQLHVKVVNNDFPLSIWDLKAAEDLCYARCAVWSIFFSGVFYVLKQVPIYFSCLREIITAVLLWSSRNVLWTTKLFRNKGKYYIYGIYCTCQQSQWTLLLETWHIGKRPVPAVWLRLQFQPTSCSIRKYVRACV